MASPDIVILGVFVADTVYRAPRLPRIGETLIGSGFAIGPGGKGSNQAVAAAKAGGNVGFLSRIGADAFGALADDIWRDAGVLPLITRDAQGATGAAFIFVNDQSGENAIIISPGVAADLSATDVAAQAESIRDARLVMTQLEQPIAAAEAFLDTAHRAGVTTILNPAPAPADALPDRILTLCDYVTPNESEAAALVGKPVTDPNSAMAAGRVLLSRGVRRAAIITLGGSGAVWVSETEAGHIPALTAGPVRDTTGAGDAFNGGLAVALSEGRDPQAAMRFATATAALAVTRDGTARAMPDRAEIDALVAQIA